MTNRLALLTSWSVRQKLNRIILVQLRRSVRAFTLASHYKTSMTAGDQRRPVTRGYIIASIIMVNILVIIYSSSIGEPTRFLLSK